MTNSGNVRELYVCPPVSRFRKEQEAQLVCKLADIDQSTSIHTIADPAELQLDANGCTRIGGYRYTWHCFAQLCQLLCSGCNPFLSDLAGMAENRAATLVDGLLAIRVFNELITLRSSCLETFRLVRNDSLKLIDGLVGPSYQFLENGALFSLAQDAAGSQLPFYCAELVGRRMVLWFRAPTPLTRLVHTGHPWPVFHGVYLCNAEASGTSLRGTLALYTRDGAAIGPYKTYGGRVKHAGTDFSTRVQQVLDKAFLAAGGDLSSVVKGLRSSQTQSLGFTVEMDEKAYRKRKQRLVHGLRQLNVPQSMAAHVLDEVLFSECVGDRTLWESMVLNMFARRTLLDVVVALVRSARKLDVDRRETIGHAAFSVLMGKLLI